MSEGGIYGISHIESGRQYVGSAVSFCKRWSKHRRDLAQNRHHNRRLQNAWNKYGPEAFRWSVLESVDDRSVLVDREQAWMDRLTPFFNIAPVAGSSLGRKHTPESRAKMSKALVGHKRNLGKVHSPEVRARLSEIQKARPHSEEQHAKIGASLRGRKRTDEQKARMSAARKGKGTGPLTPERRASISAALTGRVVSPESRARMSEAAKRRWAKTRVFSNGKRVRG